MIKFSHAELDRRARALKQAFADLQHRVERLETSTHQTSSSALRPVTPEVAGSSFVGPPNVMLTSRPRAAFSFWHEGG